MKRRFLLASPLLLLLGTMLALPSILRAVPSRYVARLPEPLQQLGAPRDQAPILPTVEMREDVNQLLQIPEVAAASAQAASGGSTLAAQPATPTPPPAIDAPANIPEATRLVPTSTPIPSPTLEPSPSPLPMPAAHRLSGFNHTFQTWNNCGPATMAMTLSYFGLSLNQDQTAAVLKPSPEDRNVSPYEMAAFVDNASDLRAIDRVNGNLDTVRRLVSNGIPVILEIGIDPPGDYSWLGWYGHYLLVVAYDDTVEQFWVYDSWFGTSDVPGENADPDGRDLPYSQVAEYWPHFNRNYIAVYKSEQEDLVARIVGAEMDDSVMWERALTAVKAETAAEPNNAFLWFNLGTVYNALGQYEQAAVAFDQARSIGLPWRMLWYQFGPYEAYYQVGRFEDVILLADVTLKDRPYFEESFYYRGLAQAALGNMELARKDLEDAVEFNANFAPAAEAIAELGS